MKLILIIFLLSFFFSSKSFSETWSCSYLWKGESRNYINQRIGNYFVKPNGVKEVIIKETENFIHLYQSFDGFDDYFATHLDKINKTFAMVALNPGGTNGMGNTKVVTDDCIVY